jgi:hypothetical protein
MKSMRKDRRLGNIDVWDIDTFDEELSQHLTGHSDLIRSYWLESRRLFDEREAQTLRGPPEHNVHADAYFTLCEGVTALMESRMIRAWHYTRLTLGEINLIHRFGMQPMTLELIRQRLEDAIAAGHIDREVAKTLYVASPYHQQAMSNREHRFWLTARPYPIDDSGVQELLEKWGGESIYANHSEGPMVELLQGIGTPCVIEVALPTSATTRASCAAENVIDAWSFHLGCSGGWGGGSDMVAVVPIKAAWIIGIHEKGGGVFENHADSYARRFPD